MSGSVWARGPKAKHIVFARSAPVGVSNQAVKTCNDQYTGKEKAASDTANKALSDFDFTGCTVTPGKYAVGGQQAPSLAKCNDAKNNGGKEAFDKCKAGFDDDVYSFCDQAQNVLQKAAMAALMAANEKYASCQALQGQLTQECQALDNKIASELPIARKAIQAALDKVPTVVELIGAAFAKAVTDSHDKAIKNIEGYNATKKSKGCPVSPVTGGAQAVKFQ
ncbi:hypothetical protein WDW37_01500 [Bdellovibrionota bacterium FG-1]